MNKSELIEVVAKVSGLTKADNGRELDGTISTISQQLKKRW